ncbi:unnamed protein product [Dibothriocephalus latus]|uniref:Uncharacterized protein n=1 Tax=Dibothriocephalus latus TaxID=60516 RepID=A0A3P6VBM0_DIBLA|nr:unnamed protein product [Dibothriocephalus latus]
MIRQLNDGMMARVTDNETIPEAFALPKSETGLCPDSIIERGGHVEPPGRHGKKQPIPVIATSVVLRDQHHCSGSSCLRLSSLCTPT